MDAATAIVIVAAVGILAAAAYLLVLIRARAADSTHERELIDTAARDARELDLEQRRHAAELEAEAERHARELEHERHRLSAELEAEVAKHAAELEAATPAEDDPLERLVGTEVVVNTRRPDDQAVRGVLLEAGPQWLELTRARWLPTRPGEAESEIAGAALVPRGHVAYVQALGPAGAVLERQ